MSRSCHDDDRQTRKSTPRAAINESMNPAARRMTRVDPLFFNRSIEHGFRVAPAAAQAAPE
jgi:hypothetical protein